MSLTLLLSFLLVSGYVTAGSDISDRYETQSASVDPRDDVTVVTTSPRSFADASIIAFAPNGSVSYYNETYDWYFDVDPVEGTKTTVEYVAVELVAQNCDRRSRMSKNQACSRNVVERVNLTTGETTRLYSRLTRPKDIGGWHDVDRINESHLLVAGSTNDRVFIVDTASQIVQWQWEVQSAFDTATGGSFPSDWAHLNDVTLLDDGRIMVSLRNQDQVVFLDPETGVLPNWTVGADGEYETLHAQHNPDYVPETRGGPAVVVADSHNNRIVEYQRTESATWNRTWTWRDLDLQWPRDADRLPNGHTLITDSNGNRLLEVDREGDIVWEIPVDTPYEAERLGTGDESAGGESARRLNLSSRAPGVTGETDEPSPSSISVRIIGAVKNLLPPFAFNSIVFILPAWFGFVDLLVALSLVGVLSAWAAVEFKWSAYSLRIPIRKG